MVKLIIICLLAGIGAGVSTGFAGLSAAVFITPLLVSVLNVPVFEAIGVALASDTLASAISAITYKKHGNINLKGARGFLITILAFTIIGTIAGYFVTATHVGNTVMNWWMVFMELVLGISFIIKPERKQKENSFLSKIKNIAIILCGIYIGFVCGFQGAGGGLMMLFTLTIVAGYEFKTAVGTSVFMMTFTALIGAASHFIMRGVPDMKILIITVIATFVSAYLAAIIANKVSNKVLGRITGIMLVCTAIGILLLSPPSF